MDPLTQEALSQAAGPGGTITSPADQAPFLEEWRGLWSGRAPMVLLPDSTDAVARILSLCQKHAIPVVPQGGNTGLVGGAAAGVQEGLSEVILSTRRLNRVRELDPENHSITAEAGCILADLQRTAREADLLFPLSLAAEGSCQLGGNLSTNAGGINVLRYGTARELVLGLEVVLPDGRVLDLLGGLRKDNTGYDLKQVFIGAEGTLGVITAATCRLYPQPLGVATAWLAVRDPAAAVALYRRAREQLGDQLVAFEIASSGACDLVLAHIPESRDPLETSYPWYVLVELAGSLDQSATQSIMESFLARCLEHGLVLDGVVASSGRQRDGLWSLRHGMSEAQKKAGASIKHDISVPVSSVPRFIEETTPALEELIPGARVVAFGHLGDGNVHFNLMQPPGEAESFLARWEEVSQLVHDRVADLGGSISAEHGIGLLKRDDLERYSDPLAMEIMVQLKHLLDPHGIMNPGKLIRSRPSQ